MAAVGTLLVVLLVAGRDLHPFVVQEDALSFSLLLVAAAASAGLRFGRRVPQVSFSFTSVVLLAAVPLVGPVAAALLGIGAAVLDARQGWWQAAALNGLMFGLATGVAAHAYAWVGGVFLGPAGVFVQARSGMVVPAPDLWWQVGLPLLAADVAFLLTNLVVLVALAGADPRAPASRVVRAAVTTAPTFLAWGVVAFVLVVLWVPAGVGPLAVLLVTAPLVLTRHVHTSFASQRRVRSRIIEAMARSGRGDGGEAHGERVMAYAQAIATELGLRPADRATVEYAARLHGVGSATPCSIERRVDGNPMLGVRAAVASHEVLSLVDFLHGSAETVLRAGDWFDGRASAGPHGDPIPLTSRILAVADAADVIATGGQAGDPQALVARLRHGAGTRFDPQVVDALARTLGQDVAPQRAVAAPVERRRPSRRVPVRQVHS